MEKPQTPTLDKMSKVSDQSQNIGAFLDWLNQQGIFLCKNKEIFDLCRKCDGLCQKEDVICSLCKGTGLYIYRTDILPIKKSFNNLLHEYFEIDPKEEEKERREIIRYIQEIKK
mgnify:FL=1